MKRFGTTTTLALLGIRHHQAQNPTKVYRYSYMPDPRKFAPIETTAEAELFPLPLRPPHEEVPDVEAFLNRISTTRNLRCAEHAKAFRDWDHLMTCGVKEMKAQGVPPNVVQHILDWQQLYRRGYVPREMDKAGPQEYWSQFTNKTNAQKGAKINYQPVPESYRPHQQGIAQRPVKDLVAANIMPPWALAEEKRLVTAAK